MLLLVVAACEREETPCERCQRQGPDSMCLNEQRCSPDGGCSLVLVDCVQRCSVTDAGSTCSEGHACITDDSNRTYCEKACRTDLCDAGKECGQSSCIPVECGTRIACTRATDFCDLPSHTCKTLDGVCSTLAQCQTPPADTLVSCAGSCLLVPQPLGTLGASEVQLSVDVLSPSSTTSFASQSDVFFEWDGANQTSIALVLRGPPKAQLLESAIWGAVLPAGTRRVSLSDGSAIIDGGWELASAPALPEHERLTFFVQQVEVRTVVGKSLAVPFIVGQPWAQLNSPCILDCENPFVPLACFQGVCHQRCASHRDCQPALCNAARVCD
ncbi:MAG: hypothetical protein QM817_25480 [Archangium sp.]